MKKEGEDCDQGDYFIKKGDYKGAQNYYRKGIDSYKNTADLSKIKKRIVYLANLLKKRKISIAFQSFKKRTRLCTSSTRDA